MRVITIIEMSVPDDGVLIIIHRPAANRVRGRATRVDLFDPAVHAKREVLVIKPGILIQ
jgi:hypothetical protein